MINKVILVGNLGADPETRTTNSGMTVSNLRIATNERTKDKDGSPYNERIASPPPGAAGAVSLRLSLLGVPHRL